MISRWAICWPVPTGCKLTFGPVAVPPLTLHFVDDAGVASVGCLVLHASVHFPGFEDLLAVNKSNIHTFVDRVWVFAFKNENVGQESFNARVGQGRHRSPRAQI
jgi:hypothetical protein